MSEPVASCRADIISLLQKKLESAAHWSARWKSKLRKEYDPGSDEQRKARVVTVEISILNFLE